MQLHEPLMALLVALAPELRPVTVPAELLALTSPPELSGAAWSEAHHGYLVVSDDTGLEEKHEAMVFVLDAEKRALLPTPVKVKGLDKLNDAEAITPGPDGTFFIVTSHSPNAKGKTPKTRRQLVHVGVQGGGLKMLGHCDLTRSEGSEPFLRAVGLDPKGALDIEGAAFREGALFLGLKSPRTNEGKAVVVKLENPLQVVRGAPPKLSRFAEFDLCDGRPEHCLGISDLLFLDDGGLLLAANAPKGEASSGGALFLVGAPVSKGKAKTLFRFEGHKPEGLAWSPDKQQVLVVFDTDRGAPLVTALSRSILVVDPEGENQ